MCCTDWNAPIGRPNATRFLEYSIPISMSFRAAPTICVQSRTVAWSNIREAIGQPSSSSPIRADFGTRTPLKSTLLCLSLASVVSAVWEIPAALVSTKNIESPWFAPDAGDVRQVTRHFSATLKLSTNILVPVMTNSSPSATAWVCTASGVKRGSGSWNAHVMMMLPWLTRGRTSCFCASEPCSAMVRAGTTVE